MLFSTGCEFFYLGRLFIQRVPNIAKGLFGNDNKQIIPVSLLLGGIFMVIVDTLARTLSPSEIPLGIITGFLGAITYVVILVKKGASA